MTPGFILRHLARESRGAGTRLGFFASCLAIGVAAVVAVAGLARSVDDGIRFRARELLGADLVVESRRPLPPELDDLLAGLDGVVVSHAREMTSVVAALGDDGEPRASRLAEIRVVTGTYPLYGELVLTPPGTLSERLAPGFGGLPSAAVAAELARTLGVIPGSTLRIGETRFAVSAIVEREPDRVNVGFTAIAPRVFLTAEGLELAGLERFGSRIRYRALIAMPPADASDARALAVRLGRDLPDAVYLDIETWDEAQPSLRRGLRQVNRFLGLIALLSLLVGGIGVAQTVRAWLASRIGSIAVLKCLGLRPREIVVLYVAETMSLGLLGSLAGAALGTAALALLPGHLPGVPAELVTPFQPLAIARGVALGVAVALIFSLRPLLAVYRVSPARVFRHDAEPLPVRRGLTLSTYAILGAGLWLMAAVQADSWRRGLEMVVAIALVIALLTGGALGLARAVREVAGRRAPLWVRHGIRALARPGSTASSTVVALGLGVMAVLAMSIVERGLTQSLDRELPRDAPSTFLVDIQPAQWPEVEAMLTTVGARRVDSVPMVSARLAAIDGVTVAKLVSERKAKAGAAPGRRHWVLTREQRLTYRAALPADNRVVSGALWSDPTRAEVSLEADFARDLGATLGSTLTLDVQGVAIDLVVTSLRTVDWATFGINFFIVVEPGVLESAPQSRVATARLDPAGDARLQQRLSGAFPNVTVIPIRDILETVLSVLRQLGRGVRALGGFTVLTGVVILAGSVSAGSARRGREVALLKTLGMTPRQILRMYAVEHGLVGLVAGILGSAGGAAVALLVLRRWLDIDAFPAGLLPAVAPFATAALAILSGLVASAEALRKRPIEVLRGES